MKIEPELIKKAHEGDAEAIETLLIRSEPILRSVTNECNLASDADDALQDARIKIYKNIKHFQEFSLVPAYIKWIKRIIKNICIDFSRKKKSELFPDADEQEKEINRNIFQGSLKAVDNYENKERVTRISRNLSAKDFEILKKKFIENEKLEKLASEGKSKKSSIGELIKIAKFKWILEEALQDWGESNFNDAKKNLSLIIPAFSPRDASRERRRLLASAYSLLASIYQVQGFYSKALEYILLAKDIWVGLDDEIKIISSNHGIASFFYSIGNYKLALSMFIELNNINKAGLDKNYHGNLERNISSIYMFQGNLKLAQLHIEKSLDYFSEEHRGRFLSAIRKRGQIETRSKNFNKAYDTLQESLIKSPPFKVLHSVMTRIALADLLFSSGEKDLALRVIKEADWTAREYGFHGQLVHIKKLLSLIDPALNKS